MSFLKIINNYLFKSREKTNVNLDKQVEKPKTKSKLTMEEKDDVMSSPLESFNVMIENNINFFSNVSLNIFLIFFSIILFFSYFYIFYKHCFIKLT